MKYLLDDYWEDADLLKEFNDKYVIPILNQGWAIDEMICGVPQETLEVEIWKDFESWAQKQVDYQLEVRAIHE